MGDSSISWTDKTWNPVVGCNRVSPGCAHCYAKALHDMRHRAHLAGKQTAPQYALPFETVQLMPNRLDYPLHWRRPARIFVNSVSDLFHENVPDEYIDAVFQIMAKCQQHTFQILTKRPERMRNYMQRSGKDILDQGLLYLAGLDDFSMVAFGRAQDKPTSVRLIDGVWPLPNVWLGTSVENQRWADERIPLLLQTPAAVHFLSCEPLLGPLNLSNYLPECSGCGAKRGDARGMELASWRWNGRCWEHKCPDTIPQAGHFAEYAGVDWVIVGGESGPGFRKMDLEWARSLRDQCVAAGVSFFYKQGNALKSEKDKELDGQRWEQMPNRGGVAA